MRQEVIKELELITDEEKRVLSGEKQQVVWDIYSSKDKFEVDSKRLIKQGGGFVARIVENGWEYGENLDKYIQTFYSITHNKRMFDQNTCIKIIQ